MSSTFSSSPHSSGSEHPSLNTPVTPEQRDRAEQWLQQAYADGRVSEEEFDRRIGAVLEAENRRQLNDAFFGLVDVPAAAPVVSPYRPPTTPRDQGAGVGALAHFAGIPTSIVGPGVVYALSSPGTTSRREAAKAFNFQLIALIAAVLGTIVLTLIPGDHFNWLMGLGWFAWLGLSIAGGVKAAQGADWTNPVKKVVKLKALPETSSPR